jgi:tRNA(Met) C34 N-acetyltransferase TmcA
VTMVAIWKFICAALSDPKTADLLNTQERDILISKVLQKWNWSEVANIAKVSGRSQVIETMRGALRKMLKS